MTTKHANLVSILLVFILVASIVPSEIVAASTPTAEQVNDYSLEVANFVKEKCHGSCENVIILGDDYVVPSFRRDIKMSPWYELFGNWFKPRTDNILTDIGYVQRGEMRFDNLYALMTKQLDGNNYEGKKILLILPDYLTDEQRRAINDLKSEFGTKFKSHFSEKKSSEIYCNDPQLWKNMNGYTLMVIGTEENNYAFNCFPFQAGLENRDAAFIDVNPWDGKSYAVIFNTEDPLIIDTFTLFIHDETFKGIRSETAYFYKMGAKVAVYGAISLAVLSGVGAAAGFAGAGAIAVTANIVNVAADALTVTDSCYYDSYKYGESVGGCVKDAVIVIVLPKVLEKTTKVAVSKAIDYLKYTDETYPALRETLERVSKYFGKDWDTIKTKLFTQRGDEILVAKAYQAHENSPTAISKLNEYVKLWRGNPFRNTDEAQNVIKVFYSPNTKIVLEGREISEAAVLKKGVQYGPNSGFGWDHIVAEGHNDQIMKEFALPDSEQSVINFIQEGLKKGIKQADGTILWKVPSSDKNLRIVMSASSPGSITTVYPY